MAHYVHDEKNNRIEALSKEETYALLAEAIQEGELPSVDEDTAFVTMFKSIVDGKAYKMGFCTQAQYNQLEAQGLLVADALYFITDDTTLEDILALISTQLATKVDQQYINIDDGITQSISNNSSGIVLYKNDYSSSHSPSGKVEVQAGSVVIRGDSSNHGEDDVDYRCILTINDTDIIISRDLGDGNAVNYDLFTELGQVETNTSNIATNTSDIAALKPIAIPVTAGTRSVDISNYGAGLYAVEVEYNSGTPYRYTSLMIITKSSLIAGIGTIYYAKDIITLDVSPNQMILRGSYCEDVAAAPTGYIEIVNPVAGMKIISIKKMW